MSVKFSDKFYLKFSGNLHIESVHIQKYASLVKRLRGTSYIGKNYAIMDSNKRYSADDIISKATEVNKENKKRAEVRKTARPRLDTQTLVYNT